MAHDAMSRLTLFVAGILGASGIALSALAAHGGDARLIGTAAAMSLAHAPALLALHASFERIRLASVAGLLIGLGCVIFVADLLFRARWGHGLFAMSAPIGGSMMIIGWLLVAVSAFLPRK
jgi:uncharacterized membrane protein YgdD (TMEM256/DUF423 family)